MIETIKTTGLDFLYGNALGFICFCCVFVFYEIEMDVVHSLISTGLTSRKYGRMFLQGADQHSESDEKHSNLVPRWKNKASKTIEAFHI